MINPGDVILAKIPYPCADGYLMQKAHMYICVGPGIYVKCQSKKPYHARRGSLPANRIETAGHPFRHLTLIDLDKVFAIGGKTLRELGAGVSAELLARIHERLGSAERIEINYNPPGQTGC